jgi:hypothetical protein
VHGSLPLASLMVARPGTPASASAAAARPAFLGATAPRPRLGAVALRCDFWRRCVFLVQTYAVPLNYGHKCKKAPNWEPLFIRAFNYSENWADIFLQGAEAPKTAVQTSKANVAHATPNCAMVA